jgi:hypothetical protein
MTPREWFLLAVIGAAMALSLLSFVLYGRVPAGVHVALAMLVLLAGSFAFFVSIGPSLAASSLLTAIVALLLVGLFRLLGRFELRRPDTRKPDDEC